MKVKFGSSGELEIESGTYSGLHVNAILKAAASNTAIAQTAYNPAKIAVKVELTRDGKTTSIMQNNLMILGTYCTQKRGRTSFYIGIDKKVAAAGVYAEKHRNVFLEFPSIVRIGKEDTLRVEVSAGAESITAALNQNTSDVDFYLQPATGYEKGIPKIQSKVIAADTDSQQLHLGNDVTRIDVLNFDKTSWQNQVVTGLTLSSDKYDLNLNAPQIIAHRDLMYQERPGYRFGDAPDNQNVFEMPDYLPQSICIFETDNILGEIPADLDDVRIDLQLDQTQVNASQNVVVWSTCTVTAKDFQDTSDRMAKHAKENLTKIATK